MDASLLCPKSHIKIKKYSSAVPSVRILPTAIGQSRNVPSCAVTIAPCGADEAFKSVDHVGVAVPGATCEVYQIFSSSEIKGLRHLCALRD